MDIIDILTNKKGFIAALDQSGGSSKKTLLNYGYSEKDIPNDDVMFDLIHNMRKRIITNEEFNSKYILGTILFRHTIEKSIDGKDTVQYILDKEIIPFMKIDVGLENLDSGVQLMKDIPNLDDTLKFAKEKGIVGTKMRSFIKEYNEYGIKKVVEQQFKYAKKIISYGLIPIIEPEVDINASNKKNIETFMKKEILMHLKKMGKEDYVLLKFTLPEIPGTYDELKRCKNVLRITALSGGYKKDVACLKVHENKKMIASFSRAFLEGLNVFETDTEFSNTLKENIIEIYTASTKK
jgi:fructose-bisphosphate aldolase class I